MTIVKQRPIYSCDHCGIKGKDEDTSNWLVLPVWQYVDSGGAGRYTKHLCSVQCAGAFVRSINLTGEPLSERKPV